MNKTDQLIRVESSPAPSERPGAWSLQLRGARHSRPVVNLLRYVILAMMILLSGENGFTQETSDLEPTTVTMKIPLIGMVDVPVYIRDEDLFLPVTDLFTFLQIHNVPSPDYDSITGFFINKQGEYLIDRTTNRIRYQGKYYGLKQGDLIRTETGLFLKSDYFGTVFGLQVEFDFRSLTVTLTTNIELPVIREMKLEMMRKNLHRLKQEVKADTTIPRRYPLFNLGMADWSFMNTQPVQGRGIFGFSFALGTILFGGETDVTLNYISNRRFAEKQQNYIWRYANNDHSFLRQVRIGKISAAPVSTLTSPLVGIQLTNTPTTYRRSFGTYTISDYTEPGWGVELYVNNVLVDYMKADASGFYTFDVPLVYGNSAIKLRFYGPWGEEKSKFQNISIPFNFLPPGKLEYLVTAAMAENSKNSLFSKAVFNYGLNKRMTIGCGAEYYTLVSKTNPMPFLNLSVRLAKNLLFTGEYIYGVRFKGFMSYNLPWDIHLEVDYSRYHRGQKSVATSFLEDRKATVTVPLHGKSFASMVRLTVDQMIMLQSKNFTSELLFSGSFHNISTNITTYAMFYNPRYPYIYSNLSLGFRLPYRILLTPQTQYDYTHTRFVSMKVEAEKQFFSHGIMRLSFEQNFHVKMWSLQLGLRYDFPFAQAGFSALGGSSTTTFIQSGSGSFLADPKTGWVGAKNLTSVGRGGVVIRAFLDLDHDGRHDPDEPRVTGLTIHMTGGHIQQDERDSCIRIYDLEPFTNYFVEIDPTSFENVAWQIKKPVISIAIDPNQFKLVEVPVSVMGEVTGMVYLDNFGELAGQGRVIITVLRGDSSVAARIRSEGDGYYSFLGLAPGSYRVRVDKTLLNKLHWTASPEEYPIEIKRMVEGDQAVGVDFILKPMEVDSAALLARTQALEKMGQGGQAGQENTTSRVSLVPPEPLVQVAGKQTDSTGYSRVTEQKDTTGQVKPAPQQAPAVQTSPEPIISRAIADSIRRAKEAAADQAERIRKQRQEEEKKRKTSARPVVPPADTSGQYLRETGRTDDCGTAIQVGAFHVRENALKSHARLSADFQQRAVIVFENNYYKVRLPGFSSSGDARKMVPDLGVKGFNETWLVNNRCNAIQVGAFHFEANAVNVRENLSVILGRKVVIVHEDGFYKVRITGFASRRDAETFLPEVVRRGFSDAFVIAY